jgi:hypothetical protein
VPSLTIDNQDPVAEVILTTVQDYVNSLQPGAIKSLAVQELGLFGATLQDFPVLLFSRLSSRGEALTYTDAALRVYLPVKSQQQHSRWLQLAIAEALVKLATVESQTLTMISSLAELICQTKYLTTDLGALVQILEFRFTIREEVW